MMKGKGDYKRAIIYQNEKEFFEKFSKKFIFNRSRELCLKNGNKKLPSIIRNERCRQDSNLYAG